MLKESPQVESQGYAFDKEEHIEGLDAVGVPILDSNDVFGAISVAKPAHWMSNDSREHEIADLILGLTDEIELNVCFLK